MSDLVERIRGRLEPLIELERERLRRRGEESCELKPKVLPWQVAWAMEGFGGDEQALRAWMHAAKPEEVRPIVCGYDDLLAGLARDDPDAIALARTIAEARLATACSLLSQRWMARVAQRAQRPGRHRSHPHGESGHLSA